MGTTLTAMLWAGGSAAICHIGDSRAYLVRDGDLYQITRDHTFVQALIDQGRIRPDEASTHPQRSLLLRALDGRTDADPDLSMLNAQLGDRYLICSDGLPVAVTDDQILQALVAVADPPDAVLALIDLAIKGGAPDNVTCIVADVIDTERPGAVATKAPVVVGAAAASGGNHDTKPFTRPALDGSGGVTTIGTIPGTIPATPSRTTQTVPGQAMPQRAPAATMPAGRHAAAAVDEADEAPALARRRRWPLMSSILALFVVLIGGGLFFGYQYVHSQYYVATSQGNVAIFRGLDQSLLGISLSSLYQTTSIPVSGLPAQDAQAITQSSSGTLAAANRLVANVRKSYQTCQAAHAAVRRWEAGKPKPIKIKVRVNGHLVTRTVMPHYRPKPHVPADCPAQPAAATG
jgi:protein phosphatase